MLGAERRELDAPVPDVLRHSRPVVGERNLSLGWTERHQVVAPDPAAELQLIAAWDAGSASTANTLAAGTVTVKVALTFSWSMVCTLLV